MTDLIKNRSKRHDDVFLSSIRANEISEIMHFLSMPITDLVSTVN